MTREFWKSKRIFITGHTGFKGSWLVMMLNEMGAEVCGYALTPPTEPSLFDVTKLSDMCEHNIGDIRDYQRLLATLTTWQPEIVIHMAAQPLVRESYVKPLETYEINVMGTANLLEAVRNCPSVRAVVVVTTDKCYQNNEWAWGYRENDRLGGYDPYSNSKACSELVVSAYRQSFFQPPVGEELSSCQVVKLSSDSTEKSDCISAFSFQLSAFVPAIATARAGNVIGGGDWAKDRLIPDILRAIEAGEPVRIRNPYSIRPWEHVLEPLAGYLQLAENLYTHGHKFAEAWNFGPSDDDAKPVEWIVERMCGLWNDQLPTTNHQPPAAYCVDDGEHPHEANYLKLDCSKSRQELGWQPSWNLSQTLEKIVEWHRAYINREDMRELSFKQIEKYLA
ncbi:MAG: CDP-glucose 4,6-dehydratase [Bacillota bacterium]